jgi:hypothetical protein
VETFDRAMAARRIPRWFGWLHAGDDLRIVRPRAAATSRIPQATVVVCGYALVGGLSAGVAIALGMDPIACDGWLHTPTIVSMLLSLGVGVWLGAVTIGATRAIVRRADWARALHAALRPAVHGASDATLLALSVASATCEELLFRGLLVPTLGVLASSLVFGALHQVRGPGRWGWMAWATVMGLLFALIFVATGSLVGPLAAHAAINHANLRFLRDNDPDPRPPTRSLGGLLNRG